MAKAINQSLLDAVLDSWDRNNTILVNLLRAVPDGGLEIRATEDGPSISELFTHIHYGRLVVVSEDAPEFASPLPEKEWAANCSVDRIAQSLHESAKVVRQAVKGRIRGTAGDGHALRSPNSHAPTHDLARGLSPRPDQAGAQDGGPSNYRRASGPPDVGHMDVQELDREDLAMSFALDHLGIFENREKWAPATSHEQAVLLLHARSLAPLVKARASG